MCSNLGQLHVLHSTALYSVCVHVCHPTVMLLCGASVCLSEWVVNQHRDSYASYIGHHAMVEYFAVTENETKTRVKFNFLQKMMQPCGLPLEKPED